ncbi:hypothetical protein BDR04DRAFT_1098713 [Suillus decipiens]|nr:hypothetical protein BDR04DRAFT_1098713 [Suillus decipiens]
MDIGSWYKTPSLDSEIATQILRESMKTGRREKVKLVRMLAATMIKMILYYRAQQQLTLACL